MLIKQDERRQMMEIELDMQDLNEIKRNYEGIANYLTSHLSSFSACGFVLQTIMNAVDNAEAQINGN